MVSSTALDTGLTHLESVEAIKEAVENNENVMICCGRMGPMCIPVYGVMEDLEPEYTHVKFFDVNFDSNAASFIRGLPETRNFTGLPFTVYFKNGMVAAATSSIQNRKQVIEILDREFGAPQ